LRPGSNAIVGFYSLSTHIVEVEKLPKEEKKGLPSSVAVPSVLIGQLAVDKRVKGRRLGEFLLLDAMQRIVAVSQQVGIRLIQVHAIDDEAKAFYVKYGFTSLVDNQRHLFYPVRRAEKLFPEGPSVSLS
jgi:predicted GNAT family N-acyltransferase